MINVFGRVCAVCALAAVILANPGLVEAAPVGAFSATISKVDHLRVGSSTPVTAKTGDEVALKDVVETQKKSRAQVTFVDETVLRIASSSQIEITEFMFDNSKLQNGSIKMVRGTLRSIVHRADGSDAHFEVVTPTAVAAARGTDFFTIVLGAITRFVCNEGVVEIRNINPAIAGVETCLAGQTVDVGQGQAPASPTPTDPRLLKQLIEQTSMIAAGTGLTTVGLLTGLLGGTLGAILGTSNTGVPAGALPGGGTVTVDASIYTMQAWQPFMSYGAPAGSDANHVMTVTRNALGNITSIRIVGTHSTTTPAPGTGPVAFDYTFSTPVVGDAQSLALTGAGTPAGVGNGPNEVTINRIGSLPVVAYQYASLFHWGVETTPTPGNWLAGIGAFGTLTPAATVPTTGTATYNGVAQGWFYNDLYVNTEEVFTANMAAAVDFGAAHTITVTFAGSQSSPTGAAPLDGLNPLNTVLNNMTATITPAGWAAGANTFTGPITDGATAAPPMAGTLQGGFFGPLVAVPGAVGGEAPNKPGNIAGSFAATNGGAGQIVGVFVGN